MQSDINKEVTYKETGDSMINFSVKEVLVQGNSIHVSARAEALEPGKYPSDSTRCYGRRLCILPW